MENVYINDDNRNFYIVSLKQQSSSSVEKKEKKHQDSIHENRQNVYFFV